MIGPLAHGAKAAKAYGRGCLRSVIAVPLGLLLGVGLVGSLLWLLKGAEGTDDPRYDLAFLVAGAVPGLLLIGVAGIAVGVANWRGRKLDPAFARWRLRGRQSGPVMRGWSGEVEGRGFDAWLSKGPQLQLYLDCEPATRGALLAASRLVEWLNLRVGQREPLAGLPSDLEGLAAYSDDPGWMRRLLDSGAVRDAVRELLHEDSRTSAILTIAPRSIVYTRRYLPLSEVRAETVEAWVGRLGELAREVDRLGPSSDGAEPTRAETWARKDRGRYLNGCLLALLASALLLLAALTAWMLAVH